MTTEQAIRVRAAAARLTLAHEQLAEGELLLRAVVAALETEAMLHGSVRPEHWDPEVFYKDAAEQLARAAENVQARLDALTVGLTRSNEGCIDIGPELRIARFKVLVPPGRGMARSHRGWAPEPCRVKT